MKLSQKSLLIGQLILVKFVGSFPVITGRKSSRTLAYGFSNPSKMKFVNINKISTSGDFQLTRMKMFDGMAKQKMRNKRSYQKRRRISVVRQRTQGEIHKVAGLCLCAFFQLSQTLVGRNGERKLRTI